MGTGRLRTVGALLALGLLATAAWAGWAIATRSPSPDDPAAGPIHCPFLAMSPPPAADLVRFVRGAAANGMSVPMAAYVAVDVTARQKGWPAVFRLEAPDLGRLDEVPGISHDDRYGAFLPRVEELARARESGGRLALQDLVDIKLEVAKWAGVATLLESSKLETALLFIRAGGDRQTWTVSTDAVLTLIAGQRPGVEVVVTPGELERVHAHADWSAAALR